MVSPEAYDHIACLMNRKIGPLVGGVLGGALMGVISLLMFRNVGAVDWLGGAILTVGGGLAFGGAIWCQERLSKRHAQQQGTARPHAQQQRTARPPLEDILGGALVGTLSSVVFSTQGVEVGLLAGAIATVAAILVFAGAVWSQERLLKDCLAQQQKTARPPLNLGAIKITVALLLILFLVGPLGIAAVLLFALFGGLMAWAIRSLYWVLTNRIPRRAGDCRNTVSRPHPELQDEPRGPRE